MNRAGVATPRGRIGVAFMVLTVFWFAIPVMAGPERADGATLVNAVIYDTWAAMLAGFAWFQALRRSRERVWLPLAAALVALTGGDILWDLSDFGVIAVSNEPASLPDFFYLPGYAGLAFTTVWVVQRYLGRGLGPVLDLMVVAGGTVAAAFPIVVHPYLGSLDEMSAFGRVLYLLYPTLDLLLTACFVAASITQARLVPLRLLGLSSGLCLLADHLYLEDLLTSSYQSGGWLDWLWLTQYTLMAVATTFRLPAVVPPRPAVVSLHRIGLLVACALLCPALLVALVFIPGSGWLRDHTEEVYAVATLVLVAVVCARLVHLLAENNRAVRRLSEALTESEQLSVDLQHQARHDAVTGLPNRHHFAERVNLLPNAAGDQHSVIFIDLDDFKAVNDAYGHAAGDQLLQIVAGRLHTFSRGSDLVARLGGDEFAMLLPGTGSAIAEGIAQRILDMLSEPVDLGERRITISASAGVAVMRGPVQRYSEALADADVAMFAAKRAGKGRVLIFAEQMREEILGDTGLGADLAAAIRERLIVAHYQPIVFLDTGRIGGLEALARWHHPERGDVPPYVFLSAAQRRGLIADLDVLMLETALADGRAWRRRQPDCRVGFNASATLLGRDDFVDVVLAALERHRMAGSALTIEVTEQAVIADVRGASRRLGELRRHGVTVALDDFGTGYSSLSYLQELPVDVLKLDRSFLTSGVVDGVVSPLVRAVIDLGHELGMLMLAEGIETAEQRAALLDVGCDLGQGWLFSRALPAAQISPVLGRLLPGADGPPAQPLRVATI